MKKYFIHKKAIVESKNIGNGSKIWAFTHILPDARIGKNANICDHTFIENDVAVGDNVTIKSGVYLWDGISVGDKVFIGPAAAFTNDRYPRSRNKNYKQERTILKEGSSIGANATIIAGITIGKHALVGAGSVITKDVPDFGLIYGNPGKLRGYICICAKKINFGETSNYKCQCGRKFKKSGIKVILLDK